MNQELERMAMNGNPLPKGLSASEQLAYLELRVLYREYKSGCVSKDQAAAEKAEVLHRLFQNRHREKLRDRMCRLYLDINTRAIRYQKERTLENADRLFAAFYKMPDGWIPGKPKD